MSGAPRATPAELLEVAADAARAGAAVLLEHWSRGVGASETKSTGTDMVSAADLGSEAALRAVLAQRRPHDLVLGEEGGLAHADGTPLAGNDAGDEGELYGLGAVAAAAGAARGGELVWICDPLDGTTNFLYGLREWAVSVAVRDAEGVVAGVVADPLAGETFRATRDGVAELERGDGTITPLQGRLDAVPPLGRALVGTGFAYNAAVRRAQGSVVAALAGEVRDVRRIGSAALDLCWAAAGRLDAYYERTVRPWDVAAGALLCEQAGLDVRLLPATGGLPAGVIAAPPSLAAPLWDRVAGGADRVDGPVVDLLD